MVINYQDKNLIVMYLQIYLAEYCGLTVHKVTPRSKKESEYYEITSNDPLVVTGYYDLPTYTSLALFMAYNYPNEGYPKRWTKSKVGEWSSEDYIYQGDQDELVSIIEDNMKAVTEHKEVAQVPERVLSYIFNEVVTPDSSPEEILRVKQMVYSYIYADIEHPTPLTYTGDLFNKIIQIQKDTINKYTIKYVDEVQTITIEKDVSTYYIGSQLNKVTSDEPFNYDIITGNITFIKKYEEGTKIKVTKNINDEISFPPQFEGYKVTGYVDPWTEIILKDGYEDGDS